MKVGQEQPAGEDLSVQHGRRRNRWGLLLVFVTVISAFYFVLSPDISNAKQTYAKAPGANTGNVQQKQKQQTRQPENKKKPSKKPNILLITTDQQRFDAIRRVQDELEHYRNVTKIRTPHLDQLSREGVYFRNAYTQCSVCVPARGTLRSGCTIERTGLQTNDLMKTYVESPWFEQRIKELTVIDQVLTENGYISENYGKWHLPDHFWQYVTYNNFDHKQERFVLEENGINQKYRAFLGDLQKSGHVSTTLKEGMQIDPQTNIPYTPAEVDSRYGSPTGTDLTEENGFPRWQRRQPSMCGEASFGNEYSKSHFIADASLKALRRLKDQDQPFFLTVSFEHPHPPVIATRKYTEFYKNEKDNLFFPRNLYDPMTNSAYDRFTNKDPKYGNYEILRGWTAMYYALIEEVDDLVGDLLQELGDEKDNTLIIFTSDHGEMLGAHGRRDKNTFYEESNKIPLFIAFPGVIESGTTVDELVSHIDLFATILDYVGLSEHDKSDGSSLRSKIEKQSYNKDYDEDMIVAEWDFRDLDLKADNITATGVVLKSNLDTDLAFMVRKDSYKLMLRKLARSHKIDMMFDLEKDPFEMNNLLGSNAQTASVETIEKVEHLRCLLLEWMHRMDGGDKQYYSNPAANGGEGLGDIEEVRLRQSWPALDFWKSDAILEMGHPVWNGTHYVRHEYLYFGKRTPGQGLVRRIRIDGEGAGVFHVELSGAENDGLDDVKMSAQECIRLKVSLATEELNQASTSSQASIKFKVADTTSGGEDTDYVVSVRMKAID